MNFYIELILRVCIFRLFLRGSANGTCYSIVSDLLAKGNWFYFCKTSFMVTSYDRYDKMKIRTEVLLFVFFGRKFTPDPLHLSVLQDLRVVHLLPRCVNNGLKFSYHHDPSRWRRGSGLDSGSGDQRSIPSVPKHHARPQTAMKLRRLRTFRCPCDGRHDK